MKLTVADIHSGSWKQNLQFVILISSLSLFSVLTSFHGHFQDDSTDLSFGQSSPVLTSFSCPICISILNAGFALSSTSNSYFCDHGRVQKNSFILSLISFSASLSSKSRAPPIV